MGVKATVTFEDGSEAEVRIRPRLLVAAERKFGEKFPRIEGTLYAVWHGLERPGKNFDAWLDTVSSFKEELEDAAPLDEGRSVEE